MKNNNFKDINDEKELNEFLEKQLKDSMAKVQGALNLLDNNKPFYARNKLLGINQKLGYIYNSLVIYNNERDNNKEG